jgi:hypothetical protein
MTPCTMESDTGNDQFVIEVPATTLTSLLEKGRMLTIFDLHDAASGQLRLVQARCVRSLHRLDVATVGLGVPSIPAK